ncbi:MAG: PKD domain-containing protein [Chitinophagales bacterium]
MFGNLMESTPSKYVRNNPPPITFYDEGTHTISRYCLQFLCIDRNKVESFAISHPVTVNAGDDTTVCSTQAPFPLVASPNGGTWSGDGITGGNIFNPALANDNIETLTYTYSDGICTISDAMIVTIISIPNLTAGNDESADIYDAQFDLTGQSPLGGFWEGIGISDSIQGTFDPAISGLGSHSVIIFTESIAGCKDTIAKNITIHDIPTVALNTDTVCALEAINFSLPLGNGSTATVDWNFGDGNTWIGNNVQHNYSSAGGNIL